MKSGRPHEASRGRRNWSIDRDTGGRQMVGGSTDMLLSVGTVVHVHEPLAFLERPRAGQARLHQGAQILNWQEVRPHCLVLADDQPPPIRVEANAVDAIANIGAPEH